MNRRKYLVVGLESRRKLERVFWYLGIRLIVICVHKKRLLSGAGSYFNEMEGHSESDVSSINSDAEEIENNESDSELEEHNELDEEDETVKAIIRECTKERDHPPPIQCEDFVTDISFHPQNDMIAVANIVGDVLFYKYNNDGNTLMSTLELHTRACRDIEFSHDGNILFSTSKDKSIMLSSVESEQLIRFYEKSHDVPIYSLTVIDENLFSTGDDDGTVKIWDTREKDDRPIYKTRKNEDYISGMVTNESKELLICSSGDGSLLTIDLRNRKIFMQSEEYEEELTCLGLFRSETKLVSGSSKGKLFIYNWKEFGLHSDIFPGPKTAISALVPITENILHDLSIEHVDICSTGNFIASSSHNNDIKFWNIQYFEDFEKVSQKHKNQNKNKELKNNLPSSEHKNASDFFSDL
ncbi:hypothetical protein NQ317_017721, partial [Molorchus minor]